MVSLRTISLHDIYSGDILTEDHKQTLSISDMRTLVHASMYLKLTCCISLPNFCTSLQRNSTNVRTSDTDWATECFVKELSFERLSNCTCNRDINVSN
jgi:hypothetical protein